MSDRELVLRLRFEGEAVSGEVDDGAQRLPFAGWLSLLSQLQQLRPAVPDPD